MHLEENPRSLIGSQDDCVQLALLMALARLRLFEQLERFVLVAAPPLGIAENVERWLPVAAIGPLGEAAHGSHR
jgi:hypothetical protein